MQRIEDYLLGKLNQEEIVELRIEFLKDPKWVEVFEIESTMNYPRGRAIGVSIRFQSYCSFRPKGSGY